MKNQPVLATREKVEYSYPGDEQYVYVMPSGLELHIGESWCLYGISGSGKSTLMTLLASLRRLSRGAISYRFRNARPCLVSPQTWEHTVGPRLWRRIGFAFQRPELIQALNVGDNLKLVHGSAAIDESLFTAEEWRQIARSRVKQISGGQIQRLGLMRAFGYAQDLVFLDEPTNNLDRRNRKSVAELVRQKSRDRALVVVSHDDDFIRHLTIDRVFTIREHPQPDGRVCRLLEPESDTTGLDSQANKAVAIAPVSDSSYVTV